MFSESDDVRASQPLGATTSVLHIREAGNMIYFWLMNDSALRLSLHLRERKKKHCLARAFSHAHTHTHTHTTHASRPSIPAPTCCPPGSPHLSPSLPPALLFFLILSPGVLKCQKCSVRRACYVPYESVSLLPGNPASMGSRSATQYLRVLWRVGGTSSPADRPPASRR